MMKLIPPVAALAAGLLLTSSCSGPEAMSTDTVEAAAANIEERKPAPEFTLKDGQGQDVSLSDFRGKVVLLNFWATWCGPCKIEMPWFVDFQRKYKDQGFSVVAISLDEEGWDVVRPFAEDMKLNFPVLLGDDELAESFGGVQALPTTFIIDKEGRIYNSHMGLVSMSDYEDEIKKLL
jgi:cytochrome c biogenesis protein CcmG/thiol:disulfide interchange protein DsbE